MSDDTPALRPPSEFAHLRWHWLKERSGKPSIWMYDPHPGFPCAWTRSDTFETDTKDAVYSHPADPAAIVPDPASERQVECLARAICQANGRDPDAPRWIDIATKETSGICWHENIKGAKAILTALAALGRGE